MSDRQPEDEGSEPEGGKKEPINDPLTGDKYAPRAPFKPGDTDE